MIIAVSNNDQHHLLHKYEESKVKEEYKVNDFLISRLFNTYDCSYVTLHEQLRKNKKASRCFDRISL